MWQSTAVLHFHFIKTAGKIILISIQIQFWEKKIYWFTSSAHRTKTALHAAFAPNKFASEIWKPPLKLNTIPEVNKPNTAYKQSLNTQLSPAKGLHKSLGFMWLNLSATTKLVLILTLNFSRYKDLMISKWCVCVCVCVCGGGGVIARVVCQR